MRLADYRPDSAMSRLELILIVAFCCVVAALALPHLHSARIEGNERLAMRNIRSLAAAQRAWKLEVMVDQDADREGEYGLLGEMAGEIMPRGATRRAEPAFARPFFFTGGAEGADGCAVAQGYIFRVFLVEEVKESGEIVPGDDRSLGGTRTAAGRTLFDVDAIDMQEDHFIIYAWPGEAGRTGSRAFFINERQELYATEMGARVYSGRGAAGSVNTPSADAAFDGEAFVSSPADRDYGNDGNLWIRLDGN